MKKAAKREKSKAHGQGYSLTLVALLIARCLRAFYTRDASWNAEKQERDTHNT